jgi:signal transduction histidine kinase
METQAAEPVDLVALLTECVNDHRPGFAGSQQRLGLDCTLDKATVVADRALLLQVFHSLLSNASEAMGAGGECLVRVRDVGHRRWQVDIVDTGCGLDEGTAAQVFRPFFTTKPKGLGLGLPLARRIVERFGGTLRLTSRPGAGTTVGIEFPGG